MSLNFAILGMLKEKAMSGYDIKKEMQSSSLMYWSGNNNQVYKALIQLSEQSYIISETIHSDGSPSKKIYSITEEGIAALIDWMIQTPVELPEYRKPFLLQIACCDLLNPKQILHLMEQYRKEINLVLTMEHEKKRRDTEEKEGIAKVIQEMTHANVLSFYETELNWLNEYEEKIRQLISEGSV